MVITLHLGVVQQVRLAPEVPVVAVVVVVVSVALAARPRHLLLHGVVTSDVSWTRPRVLRPVILVELALEVVHCGEGGRGVGGLHVAFLGGV